MRERVVHEHRIALVYRVTVTSRHISIIQERRSAPLRRHGDAPSDAQKGRRSVPMALKYSLTLSWICTRQSGQ